MSDGDEALRKANNAKRILTDPLWAEMWETYRTELLRIIESAKPSSKDVVLEAKLLLDAGRKARSIMEGWLDDGKVEAESIRIEEQRKKWFRAA